MQGTVSAFRSLSDDQVSDVFWLHRNQGYGVIEIANRFKVHHATISRILRGVKYKDLYERYSLPG